MAARKNQRTAIVFINGSSEMWSACLVNSVAASSYLLDVASAMASSILRLSERLVLNEQRDGEKVHIIGLFKGINSMTDERNPLAC